MIRTNWTGLPNWAGLLLVWLAGSAAPAQPWARDMFDSTSHDFGTVARGAKVEHTFTVENIYLEDAHIASITSSCGCTSPKISKRTLKTWEKAQIVAVVDTRGYYGRKDATLTVRFDKPFPAVVRLHVHVYIRSDVVVQPGSVQFGSVPQGAGGQRKLTISYAGRKDWQIEKVETNNPHLEAWAIKSTTAVAGQVTYDLIVQLKKDAPVGYIRDHLILVTNDVRASASRVPIAVEGVVVSSLSVQPNPLLLGVVNQGQTASRRLVVRGQTPFRIVGVTCSDARFQFTVPEAAKTLHLIPVTFTADEKPGQISEKIRIETDLAGGTALEVPVHVQVMPEAPATF